MPGTARSHNSKGTATPTPISTPTATKDPFSTPARRRRIIADVAKFLLRQYCLKACDNVVRLRRWTRASIVIQCAWRCHAGRRRLARLAFLRRHGAAMLMQGCVRRGLARHELARRRLAEWTRRATALAKVLQAALRWRRRERRKREERALHRARMLKRKHTAALNVERVFRGMRGRRAAALRRNLKSALFRRRHLAAIVVQSCWRHKRALGLMQRARRRRRAAWRVGAWALCWHRRWRRRRAGASIHMQRLCRGFLARALACRLREDKARRAWEEAERRRLEALRLAALAAAEEAATRRIEVRIAVKHSILKRMSVLGPGEAVQWCLKHKILRFAAAAGFGLGTVLVQVVGTVESVFPTLVARRGGGVGAGAGAEAEAEGVEENPQGAACSDNIVNVDASRKCIKLRKWGGDEDPSAGTDTDGDPLHNLPSEWQQVVRGGGAEVSVGRGAWSIDVKIKLAADAFAARGQSAIRWTVVTIVLEGQQEAGANLLDLLSAEAVPSLAEDDSDFTFKFKDTVVLLQRPLKPPPPELPAVPALDSAEDGPQGPALSSPMDDSFGSDAVLPSPASPDRDHRITIMIEEPPPDYEGAARVIQVGCRTWLDLRYGGRHVIRRCWRRRRRLLRWRHAVARVLARAHAAAAKMQSLLRRRLGQKRAAAQRLQVCARLKSGFSRVVERLAGDLSDIRFASQSEEESWAAFGLGPAEAEEHARAVGWMETHGRGESLGVHADSRAAAGRVQRRNSALRGMMGLARLPSAPPGTVALFSHLVAVQGSSAAAPSEAGWGAVVPLSLDGLATEPGAAEESLSSLAEGDFPALFVGLSRRMDATDRR